MIFVEDEVDASLVSTALSSTAVHLRRLADEQAERIAAGEKIGVSPEAVVLTYARVRRMERLADHVEVTSPAPLTYSPPGTPPEEDTSDGSSGAAD